MKITLHGKTLAVTAAYNEDFIRRAKRLSGKWSNPSWVFPIEVEKDVRQLCLECYGDNGTGVRETVTLRITFLKGASAARGSILIAGREIARAFGRDSGARWGEGVVCREGSCRSGGSVRNWDTIIADGTVVDLLRVPAVLVEKFQQAASADILVEVLSADIDVEALQKEKTALLARIEEIDALLSPKPEISRKLT
jgi:hypothetical protein